MTQKELEIKVKRLEDRIKRLESVIAVDELDRMEQARFEFCARQKNRRERWRVGAG